VGPVGREFLVSMESRDEDFELGVGLSLRRESDSLSVLFSYNPRRRDGDFRDRVVLALNEFGMEGAAEAARLAFKSLPAQDCSTIFGLEWQRGKALPSGTLYFEELGQLSESIVLKATREFQALVGVEWPIEWGTWGTPYILALDLEHSGASALKLYRSGPRLEGGDVCREVSVLESVEQRLAGQLWGDALQLPWPDESSGLMLQQRYVPGRAAGGKKVYRTFPYQAPGLSLAVADQLIRSVAEQFGGRRSLAVLSALTPALGADRRALFPTSVGVSFDPETGSARYGTAYWEILRPGRS